MSLWHCVCVCVSGVCVQAKLQAVARTHRTADSRQRTEDTQRQTNELLPAARVVNNYETMAQTL